MAAPRLIQDITLTFQDLNATITDKKTGRSKKILHKVSGIVQSGTSLALLGASGSGKSTLLSILANHPTRMQVTGSIEFNGQKAKASSRKQFSSLVAQETLFMGDFTVRETLQFAALFQLGYGGSKDKVQDVIMSTGLQTCADSRIGSAFFKGISSGEQRRLAMAIELLKSPSILLLDERCVFYFARDEQAGKKQSNGYIFMSHSVVAFVGIVRPNDDLKSRKNGILWKGRVACGLPKQPAFANQRA